MLRGRLLYPLALRDVHAPLEGQDTKKLMLIAAALKAAPSHFHHEVCLVSEELGLRCLGRGGQTTVGTRHGRLDAQ